MRATTSRNGGEVSIGDARENRYLKLLNKVVRAGVKTKVLMLSGSIGQQQVY